MIPILYKYLPFTGAIALLSTRQFWFRCPLQFEPWDCRADLLENLDVDEARRARRQETEEFFCSTTQYPAPYHPAGLLLHALKERQTPWTAMEVAAEFGELADDAFKDLNEHRERIKLEQEQVLRGIRVLCLCENRSSSAMWKRYADKWRGACIGFRYVAKIDNSLGAARRVQYVDEWPNIATPREWARHVLFLEEIPFDKRAVDALYMKQRRFSDEQEWRIITKPKPDTTADSSGVYRITIDPPEVAEVILGSALTIGEQATLLAAAQSFCPDAVVRRVCDVCIEEASA